jgi:hypothetical protein
VKIIEQTRRRFDEDQQKTTCEWIEGAAMTDAQRALPGAPLSAGHERLHEGKARRADRFVREMNAGGHRSELEHELKSPAFETPQGRR